MAGVSELEGSRTAVVMKEHYLNGGGGGPGTARRRTMMPSIRAAVRRLPMEDLVRVGMAAFFCRSLLFWSAAVIIVY